VAPGSPHRSGGTYELVVDAPPAPAPAWLLERLRAQRPRASTKARHGAVEPIPIGDLSSAYAYARVDAGVRYLETAALSIEGQRGRDTFFSIACYLVRRLRLPIDVAALLVAEVYNPRLVAVGTTTWGEAETVNRLESARDTSSEVPPGDVPDEVTWNRWNEIGVSL
jgi:hypothetical protein